MKDEIKEILEKIKCPQFGSAKYGSWGSLPLKVRIALKKLCEYANACDDYITTLQERINNQDFLLKEQGVELKELYARIDKAINKIDYIIDYGFDYDGFDNKEDLKKLIDMLVEYAKESKDILQGYDGFME